mgnify:CR=1 FL=1
MNMKKLIVTLVVALITFFGYNSLNAQNMKKRRSTSKHQRISDRRGECRIQTVFHRRILAGAAD